MARTPTRLEWQAAYEAAIFETDETQLSGKINAAEAVIYLRVDSFSRLPRDGEARALADALNMLDRLRRERLP